MTPRPCLQDPGSPTSQCAPRSKIQPYRVPKQVPKKLRVIAGACGPGTSVIILALRPFTYVSRQSYNAMIESGTTSPNSIRESPQHANMHLERGPEPRDRFSIFTA